MVRNGSRENGFLNEVLGKWFRVAALASIFVGVSLLIGNAAWAWDAIRLLNTIPIPGTQANLTNGKMYSFDISFVDQSTQTYYLADRSNAAIDVIDANAGTLVSQISGGFKGVVVVGGVVQGGQSGPNGVVAAFPWLFVTDGGSRVVNIDLRTGLIVAGGDVLTAISRNRADELAYAPELGLLLVINNADVPPFATFISVDQSTGALTVGARITFPDATNGAEQPVWNRHDGRFYLSIPQISGNVKTGAVYRIDPSTATFETAATIDNCGPAGLTRGPHQQLLVGCNTVFDTAGNVWNSTQDVTAAPKAVILDLDAGITTDVPGVGAGDEVWFNQGDHNYYVTGSGSPLRPTFLDPLSAAAVQGASVLGVIHAQDQSVRQLIPTFNVPAVGTGNSPTQHPAGTAHSVAANAANNHVFVPFAANNAFPNCLAGCIAVYGRD